MRWSHSEEWHTWFAWYPVNFKDGGGAWLETVERRWALESQAWCDMSGYSGSDDGWIYHAHDSSKCNNASDIRKNNV